MTEFEVGDELVHRPGYLAPVKVIGVYVDVYEVDYGPGVATHLITKQDAHTFYRRRVSRAAPPTFASCTDPGAPPVCANEKPKPTRLEEARRYLVTAANSIDATRDEIVKLTDELIEAAKAEAIEPKPYGRVLATASASYHTSDFDGDDTVLTFHVRVPYGHPIATTPTHRVNYTVTATSKGAV
jgi:hypothetical protein